MTSTSMQAFQFHSPTSIAIFAPPFSGKSFLTRQILEHADTLFKTPPEFVVYCYKEWLESFDEMKTTVRGLILHQGVPTREDMEKWTEGKQHFILVLDDLQQICENDKSVAELFTVGVHHMNFSLIYLCHNIFGRGSFSRLINLNSHYLILFRNNRDVNQVEMLGRQIFGSADNSYFLDAYRKATDRRHGYIVINIHPLAREKEFKLVSNIIPGQNTLVYMRRK